MIGGKEKQATGNGLVPASHPQARCPTTFLRAYRRDSGYPIRCRSHEQCRCQTGTYIRRKGGILCMAGVPAHFVQYSTYYYLPLYECTSTSTIMHYGYLRLLVRVPYCTVLYWYEVRTHQARLITSFTSSREAEATEGKVLYIHCTRYVRTLPMREGTADCTSTRRRGPSSFCQVINLDPLNSFLERPIPHHIHHTCTRLSFFIHRQLRYPYNGQQQTSAIMTIAVESENMVAKAFQPFVCGGSAATFASIVIHPMDLAKVRPCSWRFQTVLHWLSSFPWLKICYFTTVIRSACNSLVS